MTLAYISWLKWFSTFDGTRDVAWAVFWGGLGSCLSYLTIFPMALRHLNCHEKRCWRIGKHEYDMEGAKYKLCAKHHPAIDHRNKPRAKDFSRHFNGDTVVKRVPHKRVARDANGRFTK